MFASTKIEVVGTYVNTLPTVSRFKIKPVQPLIHMNPSNNIQCMWQQYFTHAKQLPKLRVCDVTVNWHCCKPFCQKHQGLCFTTSAHIPAPRTGLVYKWEIKFIITVVADVLAPNCDMLSDDIVLTTNQTSFHQISLVIEDLEYVYLHQSDDSFHNG